MTTLIWLDPGQSTVVIVRDSLVRWASFPIMTFERSRVELVMALRTIVDWPAVRIPSGRIDCQAAAVWAEVEVWMPSSAA
jgi:hypothetical protein